MLKKFISIICVLLTVSCSNGTKRELVNGQITSRENLKSLGIHHSKNKKQEDELSPLVFCDTKVGVWRCNKPTEKTLIVSIDEVVSKNNQKENPKKVNHFQQKASEYVKKIIINGKSEQKTVAQERHEKADEPFSKIHFDFGKYRLTQYSTEVLTNLVETVETNQKLTFLGFTDSIGELGFNNTLATLRAKEVKSFFVAAGFPSENITIHGDGKCCYIAPNNSNENRLLNRRVELYLEN